MTDIRHVNRHGAGQREPSLGPDAEAVAEIQTGAALNACAQGIFTGLKRRVRPQRENVPSDMRHLNREELAGSKTFSPI